jgi:hypothetical protein
MDLRRENEQTDFFFVGEESRVSLTVRASMAFMVAMPSHLSYGCRESWKLAGCDTGVMPRTVEECCGCQNQSSGDRCNKNKSTEDCVKLDWGGLVALSDGLQPRRVKLN